MPDLHAVDQLWFDMHPEATHRIRRATDGEAVSFQAPSALYKKLMTIVRRSDAAKVTFAFQEGDDIDRACDFELAGWFDDDLDKVA